MKQGLAVLKIGGRDLIEGEKAWRMTAIYSIRTAAGEGSGKTTTLTSGIAETTSVCHSTRQSSPYFYSSF